MIDSTWGRSLADGPATGRLGDDASPNAAPPPSRRPLARDLSNGRVGEIMDSRDTARGVRYDLRPVGGGLEWTVPEESMQLLDREPAT